MSRSGISLTLLFAIGLVSLVSPAEVSATSTKHHSKKKAATTSGVKAKRRSTAGSHAYFVPPPPAFMPTILPSQYMTASSMAVPLEAAEQPVIPENPYKKYIYTPNENDTPHVIYSSTGVANWARQTGSGVTTVSTQDSE